MNNSCSGNNEESESSSHNPLLLSCYSATPPTFSQDSAMSEQVPHNILNDSLSLSTPESPLIQVKEQMTAEQQRRDLREELKCSICFDLFRQPVSLPVCGHTFCRVCIEAYLQHSPPTTQSIVTGGDHMTAAFVHCPLCRTPSCITRTGSEWRFVENLIAANMVERVIGIQYCLYEYIINYLWIVDHWLYENSSWFIYT